MASFLTDLAKPFVEKLINGAIAELSYICCFTCIVKDFQEEQSRLEVERETLERHIEEATRRGENVQPDALAWKDEVDQLIQQDTKKKQKCFFEFCPDCLWRYSRGKLLAKMKGRIKILMVTRKELTIGLPAHLPDIERWTTQHYVHLKSRESQYTKLLVELKDDNNYMIGLQGMGGTGKTTLIKKVGKELKQSKQFTQVIDTTVSFSPNIKKIQDDIAGPLGLKFDDCNDSDRPKKLWRRLTNGERILLILDDVWGDVDFNEIGIPSSDNHKGCRIIVTTRNVSVCNKLGCNKTIQLGLLSKEDAWIMFKKYANLSETSTRFFLDKGRKIANECKNLPIAIAVIASSLKGKQLPDEWDMALKFLKKDISRNSDDDDDDDVLEIYKCLKFSYDKLDEKAKSLFLLCSVFREDEDIHTESLTRFAIGGGLFGKDYGSYEEARSRVVKSKNKLLDSCLLLTSGQRSVKMHDFARDAAQWIANNKIQTIKVYDKTQKAMLEREKNIKYLSCEGNQEEVFSCKFDGSKLEILIVIIDMARDFSDNEIQVPDSFFGNNTNLRVLHLRSVCSSLPQSMQQLKNIRSLIFTRCALGDISIFGNLQSLEELDMAHCKINEMPNGITELKKFRLLKLESCSIDESNPFEVIKRCSSLQELYFVYDSRFLYGEITWPKLQRFHVSDREIDFSISKYVSIEWTDEIFLSETTLKYCMQEAEVLRLIRIEGEWRNIIPDIVHMDQGMNDVVEFSLGYISKLKFLIYTQHTHHQVSNVFARLIVLHLKHMENLEELCNGSLSNDSFKSLERLSIENCKHLQSLSGIANQCNLKSVSLKRCPMLISLFEVSTSRSFVLLETLEVIGCENLRDLITHGRKGEGSEREIFKSDISNPMFMKLKDLQIKDCPKIEKILSLISAHDLPALKFITMKNCDKLKYIFGQDVELGSLEDMELHSVPNLIDIFPESLPLLKKLVLKNCLWTANTKSINDFVPRHYVSRSVNCTTMKELNGSMEDLLALEKINLSNSKIESIFCVNNEVNEQQVNLVLQSIELENLNVMVCPFVGPKNSFNLQNLTKMTIMGCEKLQIIFTVSILRCLPQLDQLMIHACEELKHIVEEDLDNQNMSNSSSCFPKLKGLSVQKCNKLKSVFPVSICNKLPELKALIITKAKELEEIFKSSEGGGIENFMIPNLKLVIFCDLPSLFQTQEIQVHRTKYRFIEGCDKISFTSTLRSTQTDDILDLINDVRGTHYTRYFAKLHLVMSTTKILLISYVFVCLYMQTATKSPRKEQYSVDQQNHLEETDTTITPSQVNKGLNYSLNFKHPFNFKQGNGISVEQGTTSTISKTTTSSSPIVTSEHNSSSQAPMDELTIDQQSPLEETDDATVTPSQDIKISVEGGKATTNAKTLASSTSKGETLSLLVKKELEQLVSEKHLNYETLSLLTDFLVKHPSVILKDTLLTNRYKGYAYNCLAELLKFLQTHSVLDVLGSSHSEFVGLIQDMRKFSFNKDWLDGVEKRALFPDLQFSRDAMQKLLDSKKHVTKQVEEMRLKLYFFNQHAEDIKHQLTSSEAVLASIIQQEEHVLETMAALSVPLGY
ncbi:hypothetical protein RYX36_012093 [Vicia faba]